MGNRQKKLSDSQTQALEFFDKHYVAVFDSSIKGKRPVKLADHKDPSKRLCRYCGKGKPDVKFKSVAHAVPEFLGNKSLISMNECDNCNQSFAKLYEDDLSKWFGPMRSVSQIRGKSGVPTYKSKDMRIEMTDGGLTKPVIKEHSFSFHVDHVEKGKTSPS